MTTDEIDATKAPLLDHLIELRTRLLWAIAGVTIASVSYTHLTLPTILLV